MPLLLESGEYLLLESGGADLLYLESDPLANPPLNPPPLEWSLDLCRNWERIAMVDAYDFKAMTHYNKPGAWTLEVAPEAVTAWQPTGLTVNGHPTFYGPEDVDGVRLVHGDDIVYAGMIEAISEGVGGFETIQTGNTTRWQWSGVDMWGVLATRRAYPNPATEQPWSVSHDERTGVASTVLTGYIRANIGSEALPARQWPDLSIIDGIVGSTGPWSARLQFLDELAQRIANDGQFGCRVELTWDAGVDVILYAPTDRTASVVISDQADLVNVTMRRTPTSATHVIAGGQGEGTGRMFASTTTGATGTARRERFVDQTSLTTSYELAASAATALRDGASSWIVRAELADATALAYRYGRDFIVGDLITVEINDVRYKVPIAAAAYDITATRQIVRPVLGEGVSDDWRGLIRDVANLTARLDNSID